MSSGAFFGRLLGAKGQSGPKLPAQEKIEDVAQVKEDASSAAKKEKKRRIGTGRQGNVIAGIRNALKQRLGE